VSSSGSAYSSAWRLLAAAIGAYVVLSLLGLYAFSASADRQTWIVFLTGGALVWYSW
jgi:hypothetical protein